jgi:hypothetical protein
LNNPLQQLGQKRQAWILVCNLLGYWRRGGPFLQWENDGVLTIRWETSAGERIVENDAMIGVRRQWNSFAIHVNSKSS